MKKIKTSCTVLIIITVLVSFGLASCAGARETFASFSGGSVDVSTVDLSVPIPLDGPWEFYWNRFVNPLVLLDGEPPVFDATVPFPSEWIAYGIPGVQPEGYCTWHLRITGLEPGKSYGLRSSSFLSAADIFANGKLVQSHGHPGKSMQEEEPGWFSLLSPVQAALDGSLDLVIHASNFADRQGGTRSSLFLGTYRAVAAAREAAVAYELFVVGAIAAMGAYYLSVFSFRRKEKSALWFGFLCLVLSLRVLCYDEYFLLSLVPGLPWRLLFSLGYLTFTAAVALFAAFVHATYPEEFPLWAVKAAAVSSVLYSVIVIFAPTRMSSVGLVWFQSLTLVVALGTIAALVAAALRKRLGTGLFGLGFLAMFAAMIHDILVSAGRVRGAFLMQMGMLVFLFTLSLILTRRFSGAFAQAEAHFGDLARINRSLERFVPREFLGFLKKDTIEQITLGDSSAEEMAVLFVDVRAFSTLAEACTPEETFAFINEYLARVGPAVREYGGFIDKYLGDGFMALFPGGGESALRCALAVQARVAAYNDDRQETGRTAIRVGIGVHTGRLMLGTIGEEARMDGTVISDAVNLASRLEGVSKAYDLGIAASERILADLPDPTAFRMRFIGKVKVKGKIEPVSVFDIYEGDPAELRSKKDLVRAAFERGIQAYYEHRFGDARTLFAQVLAVLPGDGATLKYLGAIESRAPQDALME